MSGSEDEEPRGDEAGCVGPGAGEQVTAILKLIRIMSNNYISSHVLCRGSTACLQVKLWKNHNPVFFITSLLQIDVILSVD